MHGYTWYPKDWQTSDRVFELNLSERAVYRELIDLAMMTDNEVQYRPRVWARRWNSTKEEIAKAFDTLKDLGLVAFNTDETACNVPECEDRLQHIRNGKKGGRPASYKGVKTPSKTPSKTPKETVLQKGLKAQYNTIQYNNNTNQYQNAHEGEAASPDKEFENKAENKGVSKGYGYPLDTPEEKEKEKEEEKDKGGARGKEAPAQNALIDPATGKIPHRVAIPKLKENRRWREQTLTHLKNMFGHHLTQQDWESWIDRFFQEKALEPDHERDGVVGYQKWFVNWLRVQLKYQTEKKAVGQHHAARRDPWVDEDGDQLSAYGTKQKNLPYMKRV